MPPSLARCGMLLVTCMSVTVPRVMCVANTKSIVEVCRRGGSVPPCAWGGVKVAWRWNCVPVRQLCKCLSVTKADRCLWRARWVSRAHTDRGVALKSPTRMT
jgi:hypothetical protein